jgi:hypothetical protein
VSIVIGIVVFTPLGFFAIMACALWIIITSVWLTVSPPGATSGSASAPAA